MSAIPFRWRLPELHEQAWFPALWREMMTELMATFALRFHPFAPAIRRLLDALGRLPGAQVLDLCSGAAGPALELARAYAKAFAADLNITLTDIYPHPWVANAAAGAAGGRIEIVREPVDARDLPAHLQGFRTMFNAFHHFAPADAQRILRAAAVSHAGIAVFEYVGRNGLWFAALLTIPLFAWIAAPFAYRSRLAIKALWTYVLPIPILLLIWDGFVSGLRAYSPAELQQLAHAADADSLEWHSGRTHSSLGLTITYLIGIPKR
jgi:hypothetical protein